MTRHSADRRASIRGPRFTHTGTTGTGRAWLVALFAGLFLAPLTPAQETSLPWSKSGAPTKAKPGRRAESARELLINVDESQWARIIDGRAWHVDEDETLTRILLRLPKFGEYDTHRLARPIESWESLVKDPAKARGELYQLRGRVTQVERVEIIPELARRFDYDHYYRVTFVTQDEQHPVLIFSRSVPEPWQKASEVHERAAAYAMFLKVGDGDTKPEQLIFAAERIAWFPEQSDPKRGILDDHVLLANLGLDFSRFADIQSRDNQPLGVLDTECFYQMFAAMRAADPQELATRAPAFELAPYIQQPGQQHGRLAKVFGRAKRITKIVLSDPALRERFGIDHYYEVDLMVPLGDTEVRIARNKDDKEGPVLSVAYPVICCVLEVPPRLQSVADRADLNEDMTIVGCNFRLWAYQSQFLDDFERQQQAGADGKSTDRRKQPSPMFLARRAEFAPPPAMDRPPVGTYIGLAILFILMIVGAVSLLSRRKPPTRLPSRPFTSSGPDSGNTTP